MLNNQVQNFVGQFLAKEQAGLRPSVSAPTAPNPFMDDSSRDIGFEKFLTGFTTAPNMATGVSSGIAIGGSDRPEFFSGNLRVGSVDDLVEDVFVSSPYTTNPFMAIGQAASKRNLQKIQENVMAGEEGYGLGIFQGRLVGVTPGGQLSGVLPGGMTREQQQELASNILASPQRRYKDEKINVTGGVLDYHPETGGVGGSVYDSDVVQRETQSTQSAYEEASGVASADYSDRGVERGRTSDPRRFAEGGTTQKDPIQRTGFVEGPPQEYAKGTTVADTENLRVREGSFVINAPITEKLQKAGVLPKGNQKRKASKGGKMMEVALSKGEYVVEPKDVPKFGGYGFLETVNDMGKPEVERRQAMQEGGFITPPERSPARMAYVGKNIPRPEIPLTDNMITAFKTYNTSKKQRPDVNNLIDSLNDRENLALLALAETTAEKATMEAMMGVQQTSLNRIKSTGVKVKGSPIVRRDFTKATDLKSTLKQRTPGRGSGSYMFQYDGLEPKFLTPKIASILKGAVTKDAITKIMASSQNILDPETEMGGPLFPDDVTFYTREDAPLAKDMEMNPQLRYATTIGGHDFYAYEASPESEDEVRLYKKYLEEKRKNSSATR